MKKITLLFLLTLITLISCSNDSDDKSSDTDNKPTEPTENQFIVSSYGRGNFYNMGRISKESLNACTDLICIGATPAENGTLNFETFDLHNGAGVTTISKLIEPCMH